MNAYDPTLTLVCPSCGDVDLQRDQVWLVLASVPDRSHYRFTCPGCDRAVRHRAQPASISVLARLVAVEELYVPAEALERHDGPALTVDDLIDLMLAPL